MSEVLLMRMADDPANITTVFWTAEWEESYFYRNVIFSAISLLVNFVTMVVLCRTRLLGPRIRVILVSMTANDVIFSLMYGIMTCMPMRVVATTAACYIAVYATICTFFSSCFNITLITIDRMLALYCPLLYRQHATMTKTVIGVLCCWILAFIFTSFAYLSSSTKLSYNDIPCVGFIGGASYGMLSISIISLVCVVTVTVMHILIFCKIRQRQRLVAPSVMRLGLRSQIRKVATASDAEARGVARIVAETGCVAATVGANAAVDASDSCCDIAGDPLRNQFLRPTNPALATSTAAKFVEPTASPSERVPEPQGDQCLSRPIPALSTTDTKDQPLPEKILFPKKPTIVTRFTATLDVSSSAGDDDVFEAAGSKSHILSPRTPPATSVTATVTLGTRTVSADGACIPSSADDKCLDTQTTAIAAGTVTDAGCGSAQAEAVISIETSHRVDSTVIEVKPRRTSDDDETNETPSGSNAQDLQDKSADDEETARADKLATSAPEEEVASGRADTNRTNTLSVPEEAKNKLSIYTIADAKNVMSAGTSVNAVYSIACANAVAVGSVWSSASETISALSSTTVCSVHVPNLAGMDSRSSSGRSCCRFLPPSVQRRLRRLRFMSCTSVVGRAGALTIALTSTFIVAYVPIAGYMVWASSQNMSTGLPTRNNQVLYYMVLVNFIEGIIRPIIYIWRVVGFKSMLRSWTCKKKVRRRRRIYPFWQRP